MGIPHHVKIAIRRLESFCPPEGYYLGFSGGKDSIVCKHLLNLAGIPYDAHYNITSVDPPELIRYIQQTHPDVIWDAPKDQNGNRVTMWNLIPKKLMPPTRLVRYCCDHLKERGGENRIVVTGVRWAESSKRSNRAIAEIKMKKADQEIIKDEEITPTPQGYIKLNNDNDKARRLVETCYTKNKTIVNPVVDWTDQEIWEFIKSEQIPYCRLYDEGFKRLGCIGCPMARTKGRELEFSRWPKYKQAYLRAFDRMLSERIKKEKPTQWKSATEIFNWWMEYDK